MPPGASGNVPAVQWQPVVDSDGCINFSNSDAALKLPDKTRENIRGLRKKLAAVRIVIVADWDGWETLARLLCSFSTTDLFPHDITLCLCQPALRFLVDAYLLVLDVTLDSTRFVPAVGRRASPQATVVNTWLSSLAHHLRPRQLVYQVFTQKDFGPPDVHAKEKDLNPSVWIWERSRVALKILCEMEKCWQLQTVTAKEVGSLIPAIGRVRHHRYFLTTGARFWHDEPYVLIPRLRANKNASIMMTFMGVGAPLLLQDHVGFLDKDWDPANDLIFSRWKPEEDRTVYVHPVTHFSIPYPKNEAPAGEKEPSQREDFVFLAPGEIETDGQVPDAPVNDDFGTDVDSNVLDRTLYTNDEMLVMEGYEDFICGITLLPVDKLSSEPLLSIDWHDNPPPKLVADIPLWQLAYNGLVPPVEPLPPAMWPFDPGAPQRAMVVRSKKRNYDIDLKRLVWFIMRKLLGVHSPPNERRQWRIPKTRFTISTAGPMPKPTPVGRLDEDTGEWYECPPWYNPRLASEFLRQVVKQVTEHEVFKNGPPYWQSQVAGAIMDHYHTNSRKSVEDWPDKHRQHVYGQRSATLAGHRKKYLHGSPFDACMEKHRIAAVVRMGVLITPRLISVKDRDPILSPEQSVRYRQLHRMIPSVPLDELYPRVELDCCRTLYMWYDEYVAIRLHEDVPTATSNRTQWHDDHAFYPVSRNDWAKTTIRDTPLPHPFMIREDNDDTSTHSDPPLDDDLPTLEELMAPGSPISFIERKRLKTAHERMVARIRLSDQLADE